MEPTRSEEEKKTRRLMEETWSQRYRMLESIGKISMKHIIHRARSRKFLRVTGLRFLKGVEWALEFIA